MKFATMNMCCETSDDEITCGVCGTTYCDTCTIEQCEICLAVSSIHNLCPRCATVVREFDATICYHHLRELVAHMHIGFCNTHSKFIILHDQRHHACDVVQCDNPSSIARDLSSKYPEVWAEQQK